MLITMSPRALDKPSLLLHGCPSRLIMKAEHGTEFPEQQFTATQGYLGRDPGFALTACTSSTGLGVLGNASARCRRHGQLLPLTAIHATGVTPSA